MFTGLIQSVGTIRSIARGGARIAIDAGKLDLAQAALGDSIAVSGVCLTLVARLGRVFEADVSQETLARTTLGGLAPGARVNLEPALTPTSRLGGHLVSGHVDGVGTVAARTPAGSSVRFRIRVPAPLAKYIAEKGSICLDGVSLTVNAVDGAEFEVNIVPHTLQQTTLDDWRPGAPVNLEVDLIARYLERLLLGEQAAEAGAGVTREFLAAHGFFK